MPVVLARIDDRLIHGQVSVGWSRKLQPDRIVLCCDEIAADSWQSRVYATCAPPGTSVSVMDRAATVAAFNEGTSCFGPDERIILLTADPKDMADLRRRGLELSNVNVGGMHYAKGKVEILEYVWLNREDIAGLRYLLSAGTRVTAQAVPGDREIHFDDDYLDTVDGRL